MGYETNMVRLEDVYDKYHPVLRQVYVLEKIHGTSAYIEYKGGEFRYHAGCVSSSDFAKLIDEKKIRKVIKEKQLGDFRIQGELYGGDIQGMKDTYGDSRRFVAFEFKNMSLVDKVSWLSVPQAHTYVQSMGLDFVSYELIPFEMEALSSARDKPSGQALRNGIEGSRIREGNVIRMVEELYSGEGTRLIFKHTSDRFKEMLHGHPIVRDSIGTKEEKKKKLEYAEQVSSKYLLLMRFTHVIDHVLEKRENKQLTRRDTALVLDEMLQDIQKDAVKDSIDWSDEVIHTIKKTTSMWFQSYLKNPTAFLEQITALNKL